MASVTPIGLYGLEIPANEEPMHSFDGLDYPCTFRITMAALDPTAPPTGDGPIRATLKMIRVQRDDEDEDDDDDDDDGLDLDALLDEEDDDDEDEEVNGGPSDPSKSSKALKRAALRKMLAAAAAGDDDEDDMEIDDKPKLNKGKAKAAPDADEDDDDEDLDSEDDVETEEFVLCTLNPETHYQQTLDITISEHESVLFQVVGSHNIHLTGNILLPASLNRPDYDEDMDEDEDEDLYDEDEDELDDLLAGASDEDDELDDLEDPRIEELDDDDEAPKLVKVDAKAAKNKKRPADEDDSLVNGEDISKLSKTQQKKLKKKLKDNAGNAVEVAAEVIPNGTKVSAKKEEVSPEKGEKKVQFAEKLVQGPTNGAAKKEEKKAAATGPRKVQGVEIDDKKIGSGPQAKNGDKVSMRYIGKLEKNKKVFDSNKKGAPFTFKLGAGQVIKGWDIGVAGMAAGGERRITIPAHLAYGSKGAPPDIPGNAVLTFDIKCLEVKK